MQITDNKKIVAYYRVSTNRQMDKGYSIENQKRMVEQYADLYGYEIVAAFQEDRSGTSMAKRSELKKALAVIDAGNAGGLITHKLDRLTRSVRDLHQLLDDYFTSKATLISVGEQLSTDTPAGRMILTILMSVSEWEAAKIKERVVATHEHLKRVNKRQGTIPYGKKLRGDARKTIIRCSEEQAVISSITTMRLSGMKYVDIVKSLDEQGVKNRKGKPFKYQSVRKIFIANNTEKANAKAKRKEKQLEERAEKKAETSRYYLDSDKRSPWFELKKEITYNIRIAKRRKEECLALFEAFNGQPRATDYKKAVERYDKSRMKCEKLIASMEEHTAFIQENRFGEPAQMKAYREKYEAATSIDEATKKRWEGFIIHA